MADRTTRQAPPPPGAPRRQVRRNLFQGLTRRPTGPTGAPVASSSSAAAALGGGVGVSVSAAAAAVAGGNGMVTGAMSGSSSGGASAETLRLDVDVLSDAGPPTGAAAAAGPLEIVVRDEHGDVELGELPTLVFDEADEVAAMDDREESNKERQRLAEAVKQHQVNHTAVREQPEELLEAVKASLRAKVAALAEDNWMFEAEPELPRAF